MGTTLHSLTPPEGARKRRKRVGRGLGSGRGKTSTRGSKGQLYHRTKMKPGFEGGQLPIHRRVPKRGFVNIHRVLVHGINVGLLQGKFAAGTAITPELLHAEGLVPKSANVIKLLATGELTTAFVIKVHRASVSARAKVEAAGGTLELLAEPEPAEAGAADAAG